MLQIIHRPETDPYFNLAAEEYILKKANVNTFMVWRNEPSVIIGKHQNRSREINHAFIDSNRIPIIRRITGGGTVYQDPGNINFSFIYTDRRENLVDYHLFTKPIVGFLRKLGLNAAFEEKSNIIIDGWKVSGNSAHVFRGKTLHHGTLLFDTNLDKLEQSIRSREDQYDDRSVRSVRKKVANIRPLLEDKMTTEAFISTFTEFVSAFYNDATSAVLAENDRQAIHTLIDEKYNTPEWNIGYSPACRFSNSWPSPAGTLQVTFDIRGGRIERFRLTGSGLPVHLSAKIENCLERCWHDYKSVVRELKNITFASETERAIVNQLAGHLF